MKNLPKSVLISLLVVGCGGNDLAPGAGNDPGDGTKTLQIEGAISAEARIDNARAADDFDTEFRVRVQLNSMPVTSGVVEITSGSGTVQLAYDGNGDWRGSASGYDEVFVLDVESGPDSVTGVRVDGPDLHYFTMPSAGAAVDSTMPLELKWARDEEAASASLRTDKLDALAIADSGNYLLAVGGLEAKRDESAENQLRITRTNRVSPAGAAGGSELSVSVRNEISVLALPNPAL